MVDAWAEGEAYEPYVGRWSRPVARSFLAWLDLPAGLAWIDVGCGTGALSEAIVADRGPRRIHALDRSADYVGYARRRTPSPLVRFLVGDAQALPLGDAAVDVAVSGLVLNFLPSPEAAVAEWARVVKPGGTVAAYVWDYAEGMELMRRFWDAAVELDPAALDLDEGRRFPLCRPDPLRTSFERAGLRAVSVTGLVVDTVFRDFEDYWSPFLGGQGPAPGYLVSLDEERRVRLRERVREGLPGESDGSIRLHARAWAAEGTVGGPPFRRKRSCNGAPE